MQRKRVASPFLYFTPKQSRRNVELCFLPLKIEILKNKPLGLLQGKVQFAIEENFKMTDEEFLQS
jgi:hypothetical protein